MANYMDVVDEQIDADLRARVVLPSLDPFEALVCTLALDGMSANRIAKELGTSRADVTRILMRVALMLKTGEVVPPAPVEPKLFDLLE